MDLLQKIGSDGKQKKKIESDGSGGSGEFSHGNCRDGDGWRERRRVIQENVKTFAS